MRSEARQRLESTWGTFYFVFLCQESADSSSLSLGRGGWDDHHSQRCRVAFLVCAFAGCAH